MKNQRMLVEKSRRIGTLMKELLRGEHKKDTLVNSSYEFSGEMVASYFSNTRSNLHSDMAYSVFSENLDLKELRLLRAIKGIDGNE